VNFCEISATYRTSSRLNKWTYFDTNVIRILNYNIIKHQGQELAMLVDLTTGVDKPNPRVVMSTNRNMVSATGRLNPASSWVDRESSKWREETKSNRTRVGINFTIGISGHN
jgi:hypothetical protein